MNELQAKQVIDALEKGEKILDNRPTLHKGLLPSYLKLIDHIYQLSKNGKVRVSDLSKSLNQTTPSITRSLIGMEKQGLIHKSFSETDKRVVYISLTELGDKTYSFYIDRYYKKLSKRLSKYDIHQLQTMMSMIDELYEDLINDPIQMEVTHE